MPTSLHRFASTLLPSPLSSSSLLSILLRVRQMAVEGLDRFTEEFSEAVDSEDEDEGGTGEGKVLSGPGGAG